MSNTAARPNGIDAMVKELGEEALQKLLGQNWLSGAGEIDLTPKEEAASKRCATAIREFMSGAPRNESGLYKISTDLAPLDDKALLTQARTDVLDRVVTPLAPTLALLVEAQVNFSEAYINGEIVRVGVDKLADAFAALLDVARYMRQLNVSASGTARWKAAVEQFAAAVRRIHVKTQVLKPGLVPYIGVGGSIEMREPAMEETVSSAGPKADDKKKKTTRFVTHTIVHERSNNVFCFCIAGSLMTILTSIVSMFVYYSCGGAADVGAFNVRPRVAIDAAMGSVVTNATDVTNFQQLCGYTLQTANYSVPVVSWATGRNYTAYEYVPGTIETSLRRFQESLLVWSVQGALVSVSVVTSWTFIAIALMLACTFRSTIFGMLRDNFGIRRVNAAQNDSDGESSSADSDPERDESDSESDEAKE